MWQRISTCRPTAPGNAAAPWPTADLRAADQGGRAVTHPRAMTDPAVLVALGYSRASIAWASRSRSRYGSPLTSTATRLIVPPVNVCGYAPG